MYMARPKTVFLMHSTKPITILYISEAHLSFSDPTQRTNIFTLIIYDTVLNKTRNCSFSLSLSGSRDQSVCNSLASLILNKIWAHFAKAGSYVRTQRSVDSNNQQTAQNKRENCEGCCLRIPGRKTVAYGYCCSIIRFVYCSEF